MKAQTLLSEGKNMTQIWDRDDFISMENHSRFYLVPFIILGSSRRLVSFIL